MKRVGISGTSHYPCSKLCSEMPIQMYGAQMANFTIWGYREVPEILLRSFLGVHMLPCECNGLTQTLVQICRPVLKWESKRYWLVIPKLEFVFNENYRSITAAMALLLDNMWFDSGIFKAPLSGCPNLFVGTLSPSRMIKYTHTHIYIYIYVNQY